MQTVTPTTTPDAPVSKLKSNNEAVQSKTRRMIMFQMIGAVVFGIMLFPALTIYNALPDTFPAKLHWLGNNMVILSFGILIWAMLIVSVVAMVH